MKLNACLLNRLLLGTGLAIALLPAGCGRAPQTGVLATVGDRQITTEDFRREIARRHAAGRPIPDKATLLDEMVTFEALLQRARGAGLTEDLQVRHEIESLIVNRLQDRELIPQLDSVSVTAAEIEAEYQAELARYARPEKVRLAVLALQLDAKASAATRARLRERLEHAREQVSEDQQLKDFGRWAIECSDDQASRYRGGDIGWLDAGQLAPRWPRPVLEAGFALPRHAISPVIETAEGCYLVRKTDSRPGSVIPRADVDGQIRQAITQRKRREIETNFRALARQRAGAVTFADALFHVELQGLAGAPGATAPAPPALTMMQKTQQP